MDLFSSTLGRQLLLTLINHAIHNIDQTNKLINRFTNNELNKVEISNTSCNTD